MLLLHAIESKSKIRGKKKTHLNTFGQINADVNDTVPKREGTQLLTGY